MKKFTFDLCNATSPPSSEFQEWAPSWFFRTQGFPITNGYIKEKVSWLMAGWFINEYNISNAIERFLQSFNTEYLYQIDGQFVLSIYSETDGSVEIYRDRIGAFPIVYSQDQNVIAISVDINEVKNMTGIVSSPSTGMFEQWPLYRKTFAPVSPFHEIHTLGPEHSLRITRTSFHEISHPMFFPTDEEYDSMNTSSQVLGDALSQSIKKRIDVSKRMGILLSGGNDSSLVVALTRQYFSGKLRTLFVTFEDNQRDYGHHAQQVADRFSTDHSSVTLSPSDYVGGWADTIKVLQTPVPMPCHIGIHHALKMLSGDVDLMIDGDGADTVFGSSIWPEMLFLTRNNRFIPTFLKNSIGKLAHSMPDDTKIARIMHMIKTALNTSLYEYPHVNAAMISESEFKKVFFRGDWQQAVHVRQSFAKGDFYKGLFSYLMLHGIPEDLATTVRLGFSQGIFFAYPFLDYGLLQASMRLPNNHRYHYRIRKAPLKKYSLNYFDREFVYKPKEGFGVPLASWFTKKELEPFLMLPLEERSVKRGWWKERELKMILDLHRRGEGNDSSAETIPWIVINMELWARICVDGDSPTLYK